MIVTQWTFYFDDALDPQLYLEEGNGEVLSNLGEARTVEEGRSAALLDQHPLVPLLYDGKAACRPGLGGSVLNLIDSNK